jgi:hypothetical protein
MKSNPNATVAGGSTGLAVLVVWAAGHFGFTLTAEEGAAAAGVRDGLAGVFGRVWRGPGK